MKNILFVRSDRIGEFLLSLPAVRLVKLNHPQSRIYLLAQKDNIDLVKRVDFIDYFLEYKPKFFTGIKGLFWLVKLLRKEKIDCIVVLNPKKKFHLAAFLARVAVRVGYRRKWGFCLNKTIADRKHLIKKREVDYNIDLVSLICPRRFEPEFKLLTDEAKTLSFLEPVFSLTKKYIVIHPFSSDIRKEIGFDFWEKLVSALRRDGAQDIVLIGSAQDERSAFIFKDRLGLISLVGKLSLPNLAVFLANNCKLFIGLDSGPMHLAAILDQAVVGLFKASDVVRWQPMRDNKLVLCAKTADDFGKRISDIMSFARTARCL